MTTLRDIFRLIPVAGYAVAFPPREELLPYAATPNGETCLTLKPAPSGIFSPLDRIRLECNVSGRLIIRDGNRRIYQEVSMDPPKTRSQEITVGGALGTHSVTLLSPSSRVLATRTFVVDCKTYIEDESGAFGSLLQELYWTMTTSDTVGAMRYKDEVFTYWVPWLLDNTCTLKGHEILLARRDLQRRLYARSQREDGMIWENFCPRTPPETDWDRRFRYAEVISQAKSR